MTVRAWLVMCIAAAAAQGCGDREDTRNPGPPVVTLLSPQPLDAVAYRDGDDAWQVLERQGNAYTFPIHRGRFSLALVCRSLGLGEVIHAYAHEVSMIRVPCGDPLGGYGLPETTHRLQGAIHGVGAGAQVTVSFGIYQTSLPAEVTPASYSIDLRPGPYDLLAIAEEKDGRTRVIVKHHVEVPAAGVVDLDFASAESLAPRLQSVRLPAVDAGERLQTGVLLTTWRGARGVLLSSTPGQLPLLDRTQLPPDNTQEVWVRSAATNAVQLRGFSQTLGVAGGVDLTLPAPITGTAAALAAEAPVARPRASFASQPGPLFYQLTIAQLVPQETVTWVVNASAQWLAGSNSLELPDLFAVPGFPPSLGPPPQVPLQLELTAVTSNRRMDVILDGVLPPGPNETTSFAKTVLSL